MKSVRAKSKCDINQTTLLNQPLNVTNDDNEKRKVPNGVSVFDLIMPWKQDVTNQSGTVSFQKDNLAKIVNATSK